VSVLKNLQVLDRFTHGVVFYLIVLSEKEKTLQDKCLLGVDGKSF